MHTCIHAYMHTYRQTDRPTHIHTYTHSKVQLKTKQNRTLHYLPLRCTALHYMTLHDIILITLHYLLLYRITLHYLTLSYITFELHYRYISKKTSFKMFQDIRKQKEMNEYLYRNPPRPNNSHPIYVQSWMRLSHCLVNICGSTVSHRLWFVLFVGVAVNISSPERTGQYVHLLLDVMF